MSNGRQVQFELLRILAMCGVVMNHVFNYGLRIYDGYSVDTSTVAGYIVWGVLELLKLISLPSVNCYVLITGYFLIEKTQFRLKGLWKVWSITWFYAVGIYLLAVAVGAAPFCRNELLHHATPLLSNTYWFVTSYIILLVLAPLLSMGLQRLSKRQYQIVLVVGGVVCFQYPLGRLIMDAQQILLFVYLYITGGYIRLFAVKPRKNSYSLLCYLGILLAMLIIALLKNHPSDNSSFSIFAMEYYGLVLPLSVAFFLVAKEWRIDRRPLRDGILAVAPLSFAVYIIHTQPVVDSWLWDVATRWLDGSLPCLLPLLCIGITLLVFLVCILIEYVRVKVVRYLSSSRSCTSR